MTAQDFCAKPVVSHLQTKLAASSVLPLPLYEAVCGYGHSGRVRNTPLAGLTPLLNFVAMISFGAAPSSTQRSRAAAISCCASAAGTPACPNALGPAPPTQCCMPGTM